MTKQVVGSMSVWAGVLKDFFRQIKDGSITLEMLQAFLEHRNPFEKPDYTSLLVDWHGFYRDMFGIEVDFSNLRIPEKRQGFNRLLIVAQGMTPQSLYDKCKELFPSVMWIDGSLDKVRNPKQSERTAKKDAYAIWIRNRIEADRELRNLSAKVLQEKNISGITLEERLVFELKYFKETEKHLDIKNVTLCSGSCDSVGRVPHVNWGYGSLGVLWCSPGSATPFLRAREVVS